MSLGNVQENVDTFVEELKNLVCDEYGEEVWRGSIQNSLARDARDFIKEKLAAEEVVDKSDLRDFAESFYTAHRAGVERVKQRINAKAKDEKKPTFASPSHGSLQNVTIYATLLQSVVEKRQNLLGRREPLSYEEATAWLEREAHQGTPVMLTDITFKVRHGYGSDYGSCLELENPEEAAAWLQGQLESHIPVEHDAHDAHYYLMPRINQRFDYVEFPHNYQALRLDRGKLIELAEAARYLLPWTREINRGVWLILTGYWQRLGVEPVQGMPESPHPWLPIRGKRAGFRSFGAEGPITLEVREWETTPEELKAYYADLRQLKRVESKTRALTYVSEVIALAALELIELRNIYAGDRGFYKQTLEHFESRAHLYGIDPYSDFAKGSTKRADAIRRALNRVEQAYQEFRKSRIFEDDKKSYTFLPLFRRK